MSRRPGVEVVEPTHERFDQPFTADTVGAEIAGLGTAPATCGPFPATAGAGGFLDLLILPAYERMP